MKDNSLTDRQVRIFAEHANGYTFKEVAGIIGIGYNRVRQEVGETKAKLGARTAAQVVAILLIEKKIGTKGDRRLVPVPAPSDQGRIGLR